MFLLLVMIFIFGSTVEQTFVNTKFKILYEEIKEENKTFLDIK